MKRVTVLFLAVAFIASTVFISKVHASDYKGEEDRGSLFQILGDLVTGNYKVDGEPIKKKGWLQVTADETKKMKMFSEKEDSPAKP